MLRQALMDASRYIFHLYQHFFHNFVAVERLDLYGFVVLLCRVHLVLLCAIVIFIIIEPSQWIESLFSMAPRLETAPPLSVKSVPAAASSGSGLDCCIKESASLRHSHRPGRL